MKNQLKNYLKIFALLLGVSVLLWNCEKEQQVYESPQDEVKTSFFKTRTVSISEIPDIKNYLIDKTNDNLFTKSSTIENAIFDEDNIIEVIDTLDYTNYSFRFVYSDTPLGTFYNLVVGKTSEGTPKEPFVLKYKCKDSQLKEYVDNNYDLNYFEGSISLHKYTDFFKKGSILKGGGDNCDKYDKYGDPVPCIRKNTDDSGSGGGNNDSGNGDNNGSSDGNGDVGDSGDSDSGDSNSSSGDNGGSAGSGCEWTLRKLPTDPCPYTDILETCLVWTLTIYCAPEEKSFKSENGDSTDPCEDCTYDFTGGVAVNPYVKVVQKVNFYLGNTLTKGQLDFLNSNQIYTTNISDFLKTSQFSKEARELAIASINNLMSYTSLNYPGKSDNLPFKWWEDENFINTNNFFKMPADNPNAPDESPNPAEALLFTLFPQESVFHVKNAIIASTGAQLVASSFSDGTNGLLNGKADAFRHAYWNALDTADLGPYITKLFTDAHEFGKNDLPSEMDLFNNAKGIAITIQNGYIITTDILTIANEVEQAVLDGKLKYISIGQLIYTNQ